MLYKVLDKDGESCNGGDAQWSLPTKNEDGTWTAGEWMPTIKGKLIPCKNGYHLTRDERVIQWLNETIWEAEYSGEVDEKADKLVCRKSRLLRKFEGWNDKTARLFAADCAEHVLHLFEKKCPDDKRPRQAIEDARKFANGEITSEELATAWAAAGDAAWDAAGDAAWAAWAAARDAARAAAWDAAWAAAGDAAWAAAGDAERKWQYQKLVEYL